MDTQRLTFDASRHEYRWLGRVVPGVTSLLSSLSNFDFLSPEDLEAAQDRGTYVHALTELNDIDDLDEEHESKGEHWPRLLAWRKFCEDHGANWEGIEEIGYSERFGFAGTLDRRGRLERFTGDAKWVIDVKSSASKSKVWGLQLAAYRQILIERDMTWPLARRGTVRLLADGTYRFDELMNPRDWDAFAALITLNNWKTYV